MSDLVLLLLKFTAVVVPLTALAVGTRVYPAARAAYVMLIPSAVTLLLVGVSWMVLPVIVLDVVVVVALVVDLFSLPRRDVFAIGREAGRVASLKKRHRVRLMLANQSPRRSFRLKVRDDVDEILAPRPAEFDVKVPPLSRMALDYVLRPRRRGAFRLECVYLRCASRLGLWQRQLTYALPTELHVYPDMKQLGEYAVLARTDRLSQLGVRRTRRIGMDHEFERLRDFTIDDNYKHIDWRATARRRKLTVKDFQASQSQRVIFLVDCGRMMTNQCEDLSLLDHALNSMLMLSYVALRQSDSVGLLCFSDEIHGFVPPRSGMKQMNRLLHASFDRFPRMVESRYDMAFRYLATHCRKRSLVVLITNLVDEVNANQVQRHLTNLAGRHLPLGVILRDRSLFDAADVAQPEGDQLWRAVAAADILSWRRQTLSDLVSHGAMALDVFPDTMTAPMVNRYLEIKARHLL